MKLHSVKCLCDEATVHKEVGLEGLEEGPGAGWQIGSVPCLQTELNFAVISLLSRDDGLRNVILSRARFFLERKGQPH